MRLFRATYRDRKGQLQESEKLYCEFRDHLEVIRRIPLYTDERASMETGRNLERLVALRMAGAAPDADLTRWLSGLEGRLITKLAEIGLLDPTRVAAAQPLGEHLDAWKDALKAKGTSERQAVQASGRARRVLVVGCQFQHYSDIIPAAVRDRLAELRKSEINAQTSNHVLTACKAFCRWMVRDQRAIQNPLEVLTPLPEKAVKQDMRHPRRVVTPAEISVLLDATAKEPTRYGMHGSDRVLLYRVAVETGLREHELACLKRGNFLLDATPPLVTISDGSTKSGYDADVPLLPGTVELLRAHMRDMLPTARAFNTPRPNDLIDSFKLDLAAAGIEYKDSAGRFFDFHSLRHCTATFLAEQGVPVKVVQDIMRHANLNTTLRYFKHTKVLKRAEALQSMPDLDFRAVSAVKEATNDAPVADAQIEVQNSKQNAKTDTAETIRACADKPLQETGDGFANRRLTAWLRGRKDSYCTTTVRFPREDCRTCRHRHHNRHRGIMHGPGTDCKPRVSDMHQMNSSQPAQSGILWGHGV